MNLGDALSTLGGRESGTARLEEAVRAYRAALEERTRDRVPLDWARTQNNLAFTLDRIARVELEVGNMAGVLAAYEEQVTIRRHLYATSSTQDAKSVLSNALGALSFALLFNHRPQDAVDRAQEALTLDPSSLWIETNRAHALLLLGRFNEAKAIYLANRSKPLGDGHIFSDAVKGDFILLRKYGIDTPEMQTIGALLASF